MILLLNDYLSAPSLVDRLDEALPLGASGAPLGRSHRVPCLLLLAQQLAEEVVLGFEPRRVRPGPGPHGLSPDGGSLRGGGRASPVPAHAQSYADSRRRVGSGLISKRWRRPSTTSASITYLAPCAWSGRRYIKSSMISSHTARSARAPVSRFSARSAMASSAPGVNSTSLPSMRKNFWYCLTIAFFGLVRIDTSVSVSSGSSVAHSGRRPTNSGIIPNSTRSSG